MIQAIVGCRREDAPPGHFRELLSSEYLELAYTLGPLAVTLACFILSVLEYFPLTITSTSTSKLPNQLLLVQFEQTDLGQTTTRLRPLLTEQSTTMSGDLPSAPATGASQNSMDATFTESPAVNAAFQAGLAGVGGALDVRVVLS